MIAIAAAVVGFLYFPDDAEQRIEKPPVIPRGVYWFQDDRFGLMVTWGPVSITGKEISWSRGGGRPCDESRERSDLQPRDKYDNLYHGFNPHRFDAGAWAELFQKSGARYVVFVAKHHDGFCMFDSRLTEYKITKSFYGRDVAADLADALHLAGLRLGFYYSQPDWSHPDYCTTRHAEYIKYLHGQVRELCENYGPVDILWFDGLSLRAADWDAVNLLRIVHELQPQALVNDRAGLPGDFEAREDNAVNPASLRPWERHITLGTQWSFKPDDTLKSASECLCALVDAAGRGGNLLLNISPQPDGQIEPRQAQVLLDMGAWLNTCGEGVYRTRVGPYDPTEMYVSTRRGHNVYLHLLGRPAKPIELPAHGLKLVASAMLSGGTASVQQKEDRLHVQVELPAAAQPPWTIRLEMDRPPMSAERR